MKQPKRYMHVYKSKDALQCVVLTSTVADRRKQRESLNKGCVKTSKPSDSDIHEGEAYDMSFSIAN